MKKALFAISSLGLWHATRTLPIIKTFLEKWYKIDIVCFWNSLNFLKNELWNKIENYIEYTDYPLLERWKWISFYFYLIYDIIVTFFKIQKENKFLENLQKEKNYDFIFSDWKYWFYNKNTKSFILSHQLSFDIPKFFSFSQKIMDSYNKNIFKKFDLLFIPDYEDKDINLAWKLSHPKWISEINHCYLWILSSFHNLEKKEIENIDYLFTISWYLKEHKDNFIKNLKFEAEKLKWKKVFILWETKKNFKEYDEKNNIEIFSFLAWEEKNKTFFKSKNIISRAGYTTIMDLVELDKKAILFPTPNQTEQEYLAKYLWEKWFFLIWKEEKDILNLENFERKKIFFNSKTKDSLEKILKIIEP